MVPAPSHSETRSAVQSMDGYSGTAKPCFRRIARAGSALEIGVEPCGDRAGPLEQHHALAQRRMVGLGNHGIGAAVGEARAEHERVGDEAADGVAGGGELRGLRDGVAEHEVRAQRVPQPALAQHRFRGAAVRRDLGVGDGEAA